MTMMRIDPFRGFEKMTRKMNDLVNDLSTGVNFEMGSFKPRVDIMQDDKNVYVHAELAGVKKENLKVKVNEDNLLTISGEKPYDSKSESETTIRTERFFGNFTRSFVLPDNLDKDSISASYEDGVLKLVIRKIEPQAPKEIDINIS
jgi:HSP20 family protein